MGIAYRTPAVCQPRISSSSSSWRDFVKRVAVSYKRSVILGATSPNDRKMTERIINHYGFGVCSLSAMNKSVYIAELLKTQQNLSRDAQQIEHKAK
jgi:hypothetical protein